MSSESFSFSTTPEVLLALDVSEALGESEKSECWSYGQVFFQRGKDAEAEGNIEAATAWRLLGQLTQISIQESNPGEPFSPLFEGPDGRPIVPSDLDDVTAGAVHQLGNQIEDAELRARLLDITWDCRRDPEAARGAVRCYVDSANRLFDPEDWVDYATRIERALRLAGQLRDEILFDVVLAKVEQKVIALDGNDPLDLTARLMELLQEFRKGNPDCMGRIAMKAAQSAEKMSDFEGARSHLKNLCWWRHMAGDDDGKRDAKVAIARSYELQAALHSSGGGELHAAHFLEQAHEAYRNIPNMREKTEKVYERLREAQCRATVELQEIRSGDVDVPELTRSAREHVAGKKVFREALLALATVTRVTNFDKRTKNVHKLMVRFPLQGFFGNKKIGRDGRVIAHGTAAFGENEDAAAQALWERVVEQVSMSYQINVQAEIMPAINQLMFEHSPSRRDMQDLVVHNSFIPPGHEELFAKGFIAGLRWNFPEALSILVPQLENSLRYLLSQSGVEITRRDKHGLQSVIQMGVILSERQDQLERILGGDIVKELKVLFSDQHGPDLRNKIAHGLMTHDDFFGAAAIYAWWFILFLCISPVHRRFRKESERNGELNASQQSDE